MDPLNNYYAYINNVFNFEVKDEQCNQNISNNAPSIVPQPYMDTYPLPHQPNIKPASELENPATDHHITQLNNNNTSENQQQTQNENNEEEIDTKEGIPLLPQHRKRGANKKERPKKKGKTSNYWNKKIEDKNFPFYGCTICDISFNTIQQLDEHVTVHKGRLTSYDIRLRNKLKRKEKIKQMKKNKKLGKLGKKAKDSIKKEDEDKFLLDIKPEDGYIGNEKASEFNNGQNPATVNPSEPVNESNPNTNSDDKCDKKDETDEKSDDKDNINKLKIPEPEDPRLLKLFKCFACQKQFSLSYYLRLHVRSHTDEKPYTCAECGQSFITASKLGRHNKRIHLAIRFQCRICYRFFSRFDILTRHFDKAHAADKIEGEPYDFNAILPYLKELEEQLREQSEAGAAKNDAPWGDCSTLVKADTLGKADTLVETDKDNKDHKDTKDILDSKYISDPSCELDTKASVGPKYEDDDKTNIVDENLISIYTSSTEPAYVKCDGDAIECWVVKEEEEEPPSPHSPASPPDAAARDDSNSDEDYFPSNTWAASPAPPPLFAPLPSPTPARRRPRRSKHAFPRQCALCEKIINTASYYKVHLRTHSGERPFKCYVCNRGFITSSKMHRHVLTHHKSEGDENGEQKVKDKLQGDENGEQKVKDEFDLDIKQEDEDVITVKKKKKNGVKVKKERIKMYRKRPHACPFCSKRFLHLDTLDVHKKSHEGETLVLRCNFCLLEQPDEPSLAEHERSHEGPRPFLCTVCNRTYTKKETMIYHRKGHEEATAGKEKKTFICDVCSKTFNAQCKLLRHLVSHKTEKVVLRYECPVCAHLFHTKYHVNMHLASHQKEGLILAENRNEILAMVLQNARQIPVKQPGAPHSPAPPSPPPPTDEERSRVCNICGQIFQHFYYLEEHLKSHATAIAFDEESKQIQNKHVCPVCNKGFKLHYYLKLHSFTHSKERPFACEQCGKGFITKGKLKRHLETHSGLKKYQCHICYKFFTRPSYLRIHVRTIHGTQDYYKFRNKEYSGEAGAV